MKTLGVLIYAPGRALDREFGRADLIGSALLAFLVSAVYSSKATGLYVQIRYLLGATGHWDQYSLRFLIEAILSTLLGQTGRLLTLAGIFLPVAILIANSLAAKRPYVSAMRERYARLLSATFYAWAASRLLMLLPAMILFQDTTPGYEAALSLAPLPYFWLLMIIIVGRTFQLSMLRSLAVLSVAMLSLVLTPFVGGVLLMLAASPLLLLIVFLLVRGYVGGLITAHRKREQFEKGLEAAAQNPLDASAHYNLGLIYEQRGQLDQAVQSYKRAVEIDPTEVDAHYRLGRIARQQGRLAEAITHFDATVRLAPDHSLFEVWREIGSTYFAAAQYEDATVALEKFLEHRPNDAQGLYYLGLVYDKLGEGEKAIEKMQAVINVVETAPGYKYRLEKQWLGQARDFLKALGVRA